MGWILRRGMDGVKPQQARFRIGRSESVRSAQPRRRFFFRSHSPLCYFQRAMIQIVLFLFLAAALAGCAAQAPVTPGATLLAGISSYQGEMQRLGGSVARWPERQRAAGSLKTIVTATVGASPEFYRLIDLDLRKKEFVATLRETSVRPDRAREMTEELAQMDEEIAALKPVIRTQLAALQLRVETEDAVEDAATRGLISLALDGFSANGRRRGGEATTTKVGRFVVTDMGSFAVVRAADGQAFRCHRFGLPEEGAGMKCDPMR